MQTVGRNFATELRWCRIGGHELALAEFPVSATNHDFEKDKDDVCRGCRDWYDRWRLVSALLTSPFLTY